MNITTGLEKKNQWHLSGVAALGLGTYGSHVFKPQNPAYKDVWHTASLYHLVHTAALLAVPITKHPNIFGGLLTSGILAFSGTEIAAAQRTLSEFSTFINFHHGETYIRTLVLLGYTFEFPAFGSVRNRLPSLLDHLTYLSADICLPSSGEVWALFSLFRRSPNLENLEIHALIAGISISLIVPSPIGIVMHTNLTQANCNQENFLPVYLILILPLTKGN